MNRNMTRLLLLLIAIPCVLIGCGVQHPPDQADGGSGLCESDEELVCVERSVCEEPPGERCVVVLECNCESIDQSAEHLTGP